MVSRWCLCGAVGDVFVGTVGTLLVSQWCLVGEKMGEKMGDTVIGDKWETN